MMNLPEEKNRLDESEINLYDIWKNIVKRKNLILGVLIIALILGAIVSLSSPRIYRGEAALRIQSIPLIPIIPTGEGGPKVQLTPLISPKELFDIIGKFDREKIELISPKNVAIINSVKIIQIPGSPDKFRVSIELTERDKFENIVKAFVEYLNNIPLIRKGLEHTREQLSKKLEEIDVVLKKSQQDAESFQKMIVREKLNPIGFNPVQFNRMLSELEIEKVILIQSLRDLRGVELISQPIISPNPIKPRPLLNMATAGIAGLILGLILVLFLNYLENLKKSRSSAGKSPIQG